MINPAHSFQDVLDAAGNLSLEEQQTLVVILQWRVAQQERLRIVDDIAEARLEHQQGKYQPTLIESLMEEIDREPRGFALDGLRAGGAQVRQEQAPRPQELVYRVEPTGRRCL